MLRVSAMQRVADVVCTSGAHRLRGCTPVQNGSGVRTHSHEKLLGRINETSSAMTMRA
eukprot:NODE_32515_length_358_cov_3.112554.p2 GENE.NODE_32515_length_358_cov_3.112554~~NODE_32515_length_358_cov_3.112554.p2  ORF type:complete len:58 (+),score=7.47 NODE_32515_length_358_cov_3.112554:60-233(+)